MKEALLGLSLLIFAGTTAMSAFAQDYPRRIASRIDWKSAASALADFQNANSSLFDETKAAAPIELENSTIPVLLLPPSETKSSSGFEVQESAYAAFYSFEGGDLAVLGSGTQLDAVAQPAEESDGQFSVSEDGADLSFARFGVSYTLRLTCRSPETDDRCQRPDFLEGIASNLVVAWANLK